LTAKGDHLISSGKKAMVKYLLIVFGMLSSATAQMFLKKTSGLPFGNILYFVYFCLAGIFYIASFGIYTLVLKYFPITKISPVMTLGTMTMVVIFGIIMFQEIITIKQLIGMVIGAAAIVLIIS
jgi:drug/metabolite transporter (DMT)-like permease